ncbi:MAG: GNAT family N-acetyltransferase, partial [Thermomicrobiales bacterium]
MTGELATTRLRLVPVDARLADAVCASPRQAGDLLGLAVAEGFPFSPGMYRYVAPRVALAPETAGWYAWLAVDPASGTIIGDGGFHGPPDDVGIAEIGYSIAPAWQGRGYATEMTGALIAWALPDPEVTAIRAETLSANLASQAILRRFGFRIAGEYDDPEDGMVIRWLLPR